MAGWIKIKALTVDQTAKLLKGSQRDQYRALQTCKLQQNDQKL